MIDDLPLHIFINLLAPLDVLDGDEVAGGAVARIPQITSLDDSKLRPRIFTAGGALPGCAARHVKRVRVCSVRIP